jgi:hypothetical protein
MRGFKGFLGQRHGDVQNRAADALNFRAAIRRACDGLRTTEPAVVQSYDAARQRVNVRLKNFPSALAIEDVPILRAGGRFRVITPLAAGEVGALVFSGTDSRGSYATALVTKAITTLCHTGRGCVFIPGAMLSEDATPTIFDAAATSEQADKLGPDDGGIFDTLTGSFLMFKSNGDVVLKCAKFYVGGVADDVVDFKAAARTGDAVAGAGAITGGSAVVFIGD